MPQMNPMNWLLLLLFFNGVMMMVMVKLHFIFKETHMEGLSIKDTEQNSMTLKI